ncbi:glycoside hydrolase family 15 protein [Streptomyces sp. NPDC059003]|uniref:glycoside hydrolase family 15 protein n=1 Tax=Streptomyces sp. NPDC059003 TaxID=3346691 RepID=UPI0036B2016F
MPLIEDHILVGDLQTSCLMDRNGTMDWLCLPKFDSPAAFASLLGNKKHGAWQLAPQDKDAVPERSYRGDSAIAETVWSLPGRAVRVIDFMPPRTAGTQKQPQVIRIVQGVRGAVRMASRLHLRFNYGQVAPRRELQEQPFGTTRGLAVAGPDAVWLDSAVEPTDHADGTTLADFTVHEGESISFALTWQASHLPPPPCPHPGQALADTEAFWANWVARCTYQGRDWEPVIRSLITLKALTYDPTGAVVAAPTTSLPEELGGSRNWDYRYTWLRDSAITLSAFLRTGYREEASAWREWLLRAVAGDPERLQIMYTITGRRELPEAVLDLPGYEGSRPVRIGNAAAHQRQLDVYGEVVDTLHLAHESGLDHDDAYQLQTDLLNYIARHWREEDAGIWEVRGPNRHFVHSKVMAWVAIDRMIQQAEARGDTKPLRRWRRLRDDIHKDVCAYGYDEERNTFTQFYGSQELDAALLLIPQVGFLPPTDKRVIGTIEAVQRELSTTHGLLLRYPTAGSETGVDGLVGDEGAFLACSFWLVEALAMIGRSDEARDLFDRLLALRNDVGLLAEEYDPVRRRQLGNFPQAFSHFALVGAALRLASPNTDSSRDDALNSEATEPNTLVDEPVLAGRAR